MFPPLQKEQIVQIVDLMVAKLAIRMVEQGMFLEMTDSARSLLADKGYDPVLGARPLRRAIQREIEDVLSEKILFGEVKAGDTVVVSTEGEGAEARFTFNRERREVLPEGEEQ